jgi:histidine triad (HIT) family protein
MSECLFCRIVRREIPAQIVAETEECLAFRDISPQAPVHVLVIPKAHVDSLSSSGAAVVMALIAKMAAEVAKGLGVADTGYRFVVNTGADGGQTVQHLHAHLLAGRSMHWPPG